MFVTYTLTLNLPVDALSVLTLLNKKTLELVKGGFPADKTLYVGIVNGKNIWRNNYTKSLAVLVQKSQLKIFLTSSCSLLHVPFTTANEENLNQHSYHFLPLQLKNWIIRDLDAIRAMVGLEALAANKELFLRLRVLVKTVNFVRIAGLIQTQTTLVPEPLQRETIQEEKLSNFQLFQQQRLVHSLKQKVRAIRFVLTVGVNCLKKNDAFSLLKILTKIKWQEDIDFDVLVHGEFERNDMVEYTSVKLSGYLFSLNGWVQSHTVCVVKLHQSWGVMSLVLSITVKYVLAMHKCTNTNLLSMF